MPLAKWLCHVFGCYRYTYQKSLTKYIHTLNYPMPDLERLCQLAAYLLVKTMRLKSAACLVLERKTNQYVVRSGEGEAHQLRLEGFSLPVDEPLFKELLKGKTVLSPVAGLGSQVNLFLPVISKSSHFNQPTLLGVVCLGQMISGDQFSGKDISFLLGLIKQASHNLETAFMHEEMRNTPSPSGRGQL